MTFIGYKYKYIVTVLIFFLFCKSLLINAQESLNKDDFFIQGLKEYNVAEYASAKTLLLKAIELDSNNDAAYYYLGLSCYALTEVDECEKYLKRAQECDPSNFWYRIRLAQLYSDTGRIEVALPLYEDLIKDYPAKSSLYYEIIDLYTNSKQIDRAIETLDKIESLRGKNESTGYARYELLNMQGKYDDAANLLVNLYKSYPSPRAAYILGEINKSKYNDSTAISYYNQALSMDPTFSPAYYGLAESYRMKRELPLYFKNIYKFFESKDMSLPYKIDYMKNVVFNPQFVQTFTSEVDTMVTCIVNAHQGDSSALIMAGSYYIQTLRPEEGKAMYRECRDLYPNDTQANIEYLSLLYYLKEWSSLAEEAKRAIELFPSDLSMKEILGIALWQNGEWDEAIKIYKQMEKVLKKEHPLLLSCFSALGDLYHQIGNSKKSYSYYEKALRINPNYNPVLNNYSYYLSLEGKKLRKAASMSKKTIKSEPDNPTYLDTYAWILHLLGESEDAKDYLKHAMLYGGKESAAILDHYAEILFTLKEYDLAFIYWEKADKMDPSMGIHSKIEKKKSEIRSK